MAHVRNGLANPTKPIRTSTTLPTRTPLKARARITLATLKSALKAHEPDVILDTELLGLALHIGSKRAFWTFTYSPHGTNPLTGKRWGSTRLELGEVGVVTLPEARRLALAAKAAVKAGRDPQREKTAARASLSAARGMARPVSVTAAEALDAYGNALVKAPTETVRRKSSAKSRKQAVAYARKAVSLMRAETFAASAIDTAAVRRMLDSLDASDAERRHVFGGLSRFLSWCCKRGMATINPCGGLDRDERPKPGKARDNAPDIRTLRNVWRAVLNETPQIRDLAQFLLLTPLRLGEASGLRWGEVDLERGWIRIDGARMKNGEPHELPLSEPALEILMRGGGAKAPDAGGLVFPHAQGAASPNWTRVTARVRRAIGQDALPADRQFRWHDIRRSFVTLLAEEFDEAALDAMLAHRRKGVAGVYQKAKYLSRRPAIMARWAAMLTEDDPRVTEPGGNVVPLRTVGGG
jgi:integrase